MRYVLDARTTTHHFPGIGRYTINLAQAMASLLGPDERLILLRDPTQPSAWDLTNLMEAQAQIVDIPSSPFSLTQQWIIPRLLRQLNADLYHSPYYLMPYRLGLPTLVTIHDLIPLLYPSYYTPSRRLIFNMAIRLAVRAACQVIAVSQATAADLQHHLRLPATKVSVILEAADPSFCPPPFEAVAILRAKVNLPEQYILYVGSNKPHKNLPRLIEAWAIVQGQLPTTSCKLVIAGMWDDRYPQAQERAAALELGDTIRFIGPVAEADLADLYAGALAFVFPSEYEGFGLPVLEAMACSTPVACSHRASLPEVAGTAALMFDPLNVESMAAAVQQLVTDPLLQADLGRRGLNQAQQFTWQQAAQQTLSLYHKSL